MRFSFVVPAAVTAIGLFAYSSPAAAEPVTPAPVTASSVIVAPSASEPQVLFIGDSVMKAYGLDISQSWPVLVGQDNQWAITNLASNGSGYVVRGENDNDFLDVVHSAASQTPDVIVLEGSSNDFGIDNDQLSAATTATFAAARQEFPSAQIIGLSTVWGAEAIPDQLADTNAQVKSAVEAVGGDYIDIGQPFSGDYSLMQGDDVHPTAAGQGALGADVGPLIAQVIATARAAAVQAATDEIRQRVAAVERMAYTARLEKLGRLN